MSYDPSVLHRQATRWPYSGQPVDPTPLSEGDFYAHAALQAELVPKESDEWQRKLAARTVTPEDVAARPWQYPQGRIPPEEGPREYPSPGERAVIGLIYVCSASIMVSLLTWLLR